MKRILYTGALIAALWSTSLVDAQLNESVQKTSNNLRHIDFIASMEATDKKLADQLRVTPMTWPVGKASSVTRADILAEFERMAAHYRPLFRHTPRPVTPDPRPLEAVTDQALRTRLEAMIKGGYVAPVGPMTLTLSESISPTQYGDALGYFVSQILTRTTPPSPTHNPNLAGISDI